MSKVSRRRKSRRRETGAIQILEEAFHLLRSADVACYWTYFLGAVPFAIGTLYFIADMSRSGLATRDAAFAALVMAALYFWMRYCQAKFCAGLWATLNPGQGATLSRRDHFARLAALWLLQAFHLPLLIVGAFFAIPLGWVMATQQNFSVLALTGAPSGRPLRDLLIKSIRYSHHEWAQNHAILLIFFFISLFTWLNIVVSCVLVSGFGKSFFGVENVFTLSPMAAMLNTTFFLGSFLLMQLAILPLMHATYVLRCFYADSRTSGADLLSRLAAAKEKRGRERVTDPGNGARAAVLILVFLSLSGVVGAQENETKAPSPPAAVGSAGPQSEATERFRDEIAGTLEQKKYQWQLSRRALALEGDEEKSWLSLRIKEIADSAKRLVDAAGKWLDEMIRRLMERNAAGGGKGKEPDFRFFKEISSSASLALTALILGLLVWMSFVLYRKHRSQIKTEIIDEGGSAVIDLESEDIVATQLHEDEWLRLAREQIGKGDERLAVRALFLATLAHLGDKGLLRIARFKSNRDYRTELVMRTRNLAELRRAFDENTTLFERAWYGMHQLGDGSIEYYLKNHETITSESTRGAVSAAPVPAGRK